MFVCVFFSSSSSSPYWMTAIIMPLTFSFWILDGWMMMMMKFIIYFHVGYKNDGIVIGISHEILIDPRYYIPLFQFFRLVVFPLCPRRKIHKGPKFSFHLFSSLWILSSHTHTQMDPLTSVCHFLVERQKRGGGGLAAVCHSFLRLLLFQVSPPTDAFAPPSRVNLYLHADRPTDRQRFILKKGKRNAGQNRIDSLMDCRFLFHPGVPRKRRWLAFVRSRFGCGQPIFGR